MASNSFGIIYRFTTFGESHGVAIGVVIDGCPPGIALSEEDLCIELKKRAPGITAHTSPRKEPDRPKIISGCFEGVTTGAPLTVLIENVDADSSAYEPVKEILRPGSAGFTYLEKYGVYDWRGSGRASARETACRVIAGAVAKKVLAGRNISCHASWSAGASLEEVQADGDSIGGIVKCHIEGVPAGLGDPVYEKLSARLAYAMMSLPAARGFEIGEGFKSVTMRGSQHNDQFEADGKGVRLCSNHAGGILGGISTGETIYFQVAFKPASGIKKEQKSVTRSGEVVTYSLPNHSRHDPCVAIRAVPVVEAMAFCVILDALLLQNSFESYRLEQKKSR